MSLISRSTRRQAWRYPLLLMFGLVVASVALGGCAKSAPSGPADTVQSLLEARSEGTTDSAVYRRFVKSDDLAQTLAADSASRPTTEKPTPDWVSPKVAEETSATATVLVEWRRDPKFGDWPKTTSFLLEKQGGKWLVVDAVEGTATAEPEK